MDKKTFYGNITELCNAFRQPMLNEASIKSYWRSLKDVPDETFMLICDQVVRENDKFPSIAAFLKLSKEHKTYPVLEFKAPEFP